MGSEMCIRDRIEDGDRRDEERRVAGGLDAPDLVPLAHLADPLDERTAIRQIPARVSGPPGLGERAPRILDPSLLGEDVAEQEPGPPSVLLVQSEGRARAPVGARDVCGEAGGSVRHQAKTRWTRGIWVRMFGAQGRAMTCTPE